MKNDLHLLSIETDGAKDIDFTLDAFNLLLDIKYLIKDYYCATFYESEHYLKLKFNNGQTFKISVEEVK